MALAKQDAIHDWLDLIGPTNASRAREEAPTTLRARFGQDSTKNGLHGSDHYFTAEKEIRLMFPQSITEPVYNGQLVRDYLQRNVNPVLLKGLSQLCREKPPEPVVW